MSTRKCNKPRRIVLSPRGKLLPAIIVCLVMVTGSTTAGFATVHLVYGDAQSSSVRAALNWLSTKSEQDGSYGQYSQASTPAAAYALWLNDSGSPKARDSFTWLASQLDNHSNDIGEADISGEILYSLRMSSNTGLLHNSSDYAGILSYQDTDGGFKGYFDTQLIRTVTSSVDTAFALLALTGTSSINNTSMTKTTNYLVQLQNSDGSFNLTRTKSSLGANDSLGPEPVSTTALVVFALGQASFSSSDSHVSKALSFLTRTASTNFTSTHDNRGHVYAASLAALVFKTFGLTAELSSAQTFIRSQQNLTDGGFYDVARFSKRSNSLDTGWAAVALQQTSQSQGPEQSLSLPGSWLIAAILGVALVAVLGVIGFARRSKIKKSVLVASAQP